MNTYNFDELIERRGTGCVKWDEAPDEVIPMWVADMDFKVAPAIQKAIQKRAEHGVFAYTLVEEDYYEAVISWFHRRHHWDIKREDILYTTGVVPAMSCAIKALTMPGEKVIMLSPDYNCFFSSIRNNGCEVVESVLRPRPNIEEQGYEVDWEDFERQCADEKTTVFLLCNPHNPTGRVWTKEELKQMADICHKYHVQIVSDEIHGELIMPGYQFCPMAVVDPDAIILNSPSKSFNIAGLQTANIICTQPELRRRINRAINIHEVCDLNPFGPVALKAAYNESENWIDELNQYIWENYQALRNFFAEELPQCKVCKMEGTYLIWVDVSALNEPVEQLCDRLMTEGKVWLNPGTMYGPESGKGFIRINIACPKSRMMEGLQRIKATIKK